MLKIVIFGNSYEGTSSENGGMIPDNHAVVGRLPYIQASFAGSVGSVRAPRQGQARFKRRKRAAQCPKMFFWGIILHDTVNFPRKAVIFVESLIFRLKLQCQFVVLENGNYAMAGLQPYIYPHFVAQWHPSEPLDGAKLVSNAGKGLLSAQSRLFGVFL